MINLFLFGVLALVLFSVILFVARLGSGWLYGAIVANLLFISVFGAKLVTILGFTTNVGNIFYAAVFFATYLLIERYGASHAYPSVWIGLMGALMLTFASQVMLLFIDLGTATEVDRAIRTLFEAVPRIALASVIAFTGAQHLNIWLYEKIRTAFHGRRLWLRAGVAIVCAQLVDSILFFSIAFGGVLPLPILLEAMLIGYAVKVFLGVLSIPGLYVSSRLGWL